MDTTRADPPCPSLLGESPAMQQVHEQLQEVAATELAALLLGEMGTAKRGARLLHIKPTILRSHLQKLGLLQARGRRCANR